MVSQQVVALSFPSQLKLNGWCNNFQLTIHVTHNQQSQTKLIVLGLSVYQNQTDI